MEEEHVHQFVTIGKAGTIQPCKGCGKLLEPIIIYLHPDQKETLDWLIKDRKKNANSIIEHLIWLEGNKRRNAAAKRIRPQKT